MEHSRWVLGAVFRIRQFGLQDAKGPTLGATEVGVLRHLRFYVRALNQGLESDFGCRMAGHRLARKEGFFTDTGI